MDAESHEVAVARELFDCRGPATHYIYVVPEDPSAVIRAVSTAVTYGWGAIPVGVRLGDHAWTTSLFPKDGRYLVPIRKTVRLAEGLAEGDVVDVELVIGT